MPLISVLGQVLEHIDLDRWERPAQMLRLIATLQEGPNPVPLGRQLLEATGRSARQAKYDHEVLVRLADRDRVLMRWRGEGRRPDSWAVAPIEKWRHVPWITPRRDVLRAFSSPLPDEAVALWAKRAAQAVELGTDTPLLKALSASGLSVNLRATTPRHMSTTPPLPGETPLGSVHNATDPAAPVNAFSSSLTTFENYSLPTGSERERSVPETEAGEKLRRALEAKMGAHVYGRLAAQVVEFGASYAPRIDELLALVATIPPETRLIVGALPYLAEAMSRPRPASPGKDCNRCHGKGVVELEDGSAARCEHRPLDGPTGIVE